MRIPLFMETTTWERLAQGRGYWVMAESLQPRCHIAGPIVVRIIVIIGEKQQ